MQRFLRDFRFGVRLLAKDLGFTLVAVFMLALGIAGTTAVFTVANALMLRPFPYRSSDQLVSVTIQSPRTKYDGTLIRYELLRDHGASLSAVAAWAADTLNLSGRGEPEQVAVGRVTPNFFSVLGVEPRLGRTFTPDEGRVESKPVVVLSDSVWRSRYGGNPSIIDQAVFLDGTPYTVVGVLPPDVQFPFVGAVDLWTPRYFELTLIPPQRLHQGVGYLGLLGRLRPGMSLENANAELGVLNQQYRKENPAAPDGGPEVDMTASPLRDLVVGKVRSKVWLLLGAVSLVLLIACGNVASLLLSRGLVRRREIAVRTAMGAGRGEILRQILTESTLLALIAGAVGVLLAWGATRALVVWAAEQVPQGVPIGMDLRVLLFALALAILTGIFFGVFPALQLVNLDPHTTLREQGRGTSAGHSHSRMKSLLVIAQVAISLLLLIGAALLLRSYERLLRIDSGFDPHNVLTMNISLPTVKYAKPQKQIGFFDEVLRRVTQIPAVRSAAISAALPLHSIRITPMLPEGQPNVPLAQRPFLDIEAVSPQWFATMRVPLLAGRHFTDADILDAPKVLIVNASFARQFWPGQNPIGKHVLVGRWTQPGEVIGLSADAKNRGLAEEPQAQVYVPFAQLPWSNMNLLVRTTVEPETMISSVRSQIALVDPDQPVTNAQPVDALMNSSRTQPRFIMVLLGTFSATALVLALMGIYGVLAYSVAQRRQEISIRVALGATRRHILLLVVRQGLVLAISGIAIGMITALAVTRVISSFLYKVGPRDLVSFAFAPLLFLAVALLTCYVPAHRATEVDPISALRQG